MGLVYRDKLDLDKAMIFY